MPYTCIIVDDEPLARQVLFDLIQNIDQIEVIGICADAIEAANLIRKSPPDILFLDINMPKLSGLGNFCFNQNISLCYLANQFLIESSSFPKLYLSVCYYYKMKIL